MLWGVDEVVASIHQGGRSSGKSESEKSEESVEFVSTVHMPPITRSQHTAASATTSTIGELPVYTSYLLLLHIIHLFFLVGLTSEATELVETDSSLQADLDRSRRLVGRLHARIKRLEEEGNATATRILMDGNDRGDSDSDREREDYEQALADVRDECNSKVRAMEDELSETTAALEDALADAEGVRIEQSRLQRHVEELLKRAEDAEAALEESKSSYHITKYFKPR